MSITYAYPRGRKEPPIMMDDVPLGGDDVLLHLREGDEPYMLITQDGTWMHVLACVINQMLTRPHLFNLCLEDWVVSLGKDTVRSRMFASVLREHGVLLPSVGRMPSASQNNPTATKGGSRDLI